MCAIDTFVGYNNFNFCKFWNGLVSPVNDISMGRDNSYASGNTSKNAFLRHSFPYLFG